MNFVKSLCRSNHVITNHHAFTPSVGTDIRKDRKAIVNYPFAKYDGLCWLLQRASSVSPPNLASQKDR